MSEFTEVTAFLELLISNSDLEGFCSAALIFHDGRFKISERRTHYPTGQTVWKFSHEQCHAGLTSQDWQQLTAKVMKIRKEHPKCVERSTF